MTNIAFEVWRFWEDSVYYVPFYTKCKRAVTHVVEPSFDLQNGREGILLPLKQYSIIFAFDMNHESWNGKEGHPVAVIE